MTKIALFPTSIPDFTNGSFTPESVIAAIFKVGFIVIGIMFVIFGIIMIRQVRVMNETVKTPLGPLLQLLSWLFFGLTLFFLGGVFLFL